MICAGCKKLKGGKTQDASTAWFSYMQHAATTVCWGKISAADRQEWLRLGYAGFEPDEQTWEPYEQTWEPAEQTWESELDRKGKGKGKGKTLEEAYNEGHREGFQRGYDMASRSSSSAVRLRSPRRPQSPRRGPSERQVSGK